MVYQAKFMMYSKKQHLFLGVYEFSGSTNEVFLYWESADTRPANIEGNTIKGMLVYQMCLYIAHCFVHVKV